VSAASPAALLREDAREILAAVGQPIADMQAESTADLTRFAVQPIPGHERGTSSWQSLTRAGSLETDFLTGQIVLTAASGVPRPAMAGGARTGFCQFFPPRRLPGRPGATSSVIPAGATPASAYGQAPTAARPARIWPRVAERIWP
jgi:hypothetical protein